MRKSNLFALCWGMIFCCVPFSYGRITIGSGGGFVVDSGGVLALGTAVLDGGLIRNTLGGTISGNVPCAQTSFQGAAGAGTVIADGTFSFDDNTVILGDNQRVVLDGSAVISQITINGSPSTIRGIGSTISDDISINSGKELVADITGSLDANIIFADSSSTLSLFSDLTFAAGKALVSTTGATINFNGNSLTVQGNADFSPEFTGEMYLYDADVVLNGPALIGGSDSVIHFTTSGSITGTNNFFHFSSGASMDNGGHAVYLSNLIFDVAPSASSFSGSAVWNLDNCTFSVGGKSITLNGPANLGDNSFGAVTASLNSNFTLPNNWVVADAGLVIHGNGYSFDFASDTHIDNGGHDVTFNNVSLILGAESLIGSGHWNFVNCTIVTATGSLNITGSLSVASGGGLDISGGAGGPILLGAQTTITLLRDYYADAEWRANDYSVLIRGDGHCFAFGGGGLLNSGSGYSLSFENISFLGLTSNKFTGPSSFVFRNCTFFGGSAGSITVNGIVDGRSTIDIFGSAGVSFSYETEIILRSDIACAGVWTVNGPLNVNGNGYTFDMTNAGLELHVIGLAGGTIAHEFSNMTINNLNGSKVAFYAGNIWELNNVTVLVEGDGVDWSGDSHGFLNVTGPVTFVTGQYSVIPQVGSTICPNITVWYDTLGSADAANVSGFTLTGTSRVAWLGSGTDILSAPLTDHTFTSMSSPCGLLQDMYLYAPTSGSSHQATLTFNGGSTCAFDGYGRTIFFPQRAVVSTDPTVLYVAGNTTAVLRRTVLDGFKPGSYEVDSGSSLCFGDGCVVRLQDDWTVGEAGGAATELTFGSSVTAENELMRLDLNGHVLDLSNPSAIIRLQGKSDITDGGQHNVLYVENGSIINLAHSKLTAVDNCTLVLKNVELILADTFTWPASSGSPLANLRFEGNCSIRGSAENRVFSNVSGGTFTIAPDSTLQLWDGVTLSWDCVGDASFSMDSLSSVLALTGATFRRSDQDADTCPVLVLSGGTFVADQTATLCPGTCGMKIGDSVGSSSLHIIVRPGSRIIQSSVSGISSPGSIIYDNPA